MDMALTELLGTPDICDQHRHAIQVAQPVFQSYGGLSRMCATVVTLKIDQNNRAFWDLLRQPGEGRIIVVDAGADIGAVMGDKMAVLAVENGWKGVVINGYIRDTAIIKTLSIGVWALGVYPMKGERMTEAETNVPLSFAGLNVSPGQFLYADEDGVLIADQAFERFNRYF